MRIEINAGGLGAGAAVAEYQWNMSGFISDAESVISSFKAVNSKVNDLNGGVGALQGAVDAISERIHQEEAKKEAAAVVQKKSNDFLDLAIRVDKQVASLVDQTRDEFYKTNPWLKPAVSTNDIAWYGNVWDWLDETARKAWDGAERVYEYLLDSYNNHGWAYYVWEGGKILWTIAKGMVKIIGSAAAFETGVGIPVAIVGLISAYNDVWSAVVDARHLIAGEYDQVGATDLLKDTLVDGYGELGRVLGNEETGKLAGELVYIGIDVVSFLNGADKMLKSFGKLNTDIYGDTKYSFVWGETSYDDLFENEFDGLSKLSLEKIIKGNILGIHPDSTFNFVIDAVEKSYKTYDKGSSVAEKLINLFAC